MDVPKGVTLTLVGAPTRRTTAIALAIKIVIATALKAILSWILKIFIRYFFITRVMSAPRTPTRTVPTSP